VIIKPRENLTVELKSAPECFVTYSKLIGRKQQNIFTKYIDEKGQVTKKQFELMEDVFTNFLHSWEGFLIENENGETSELECNYDNFLLIEDQDIKDEIQSLIFPSVSKNGKATNPVKNSKAERKS